jgi:proline iminopeptidase
MPQTITTHQIPVKNGTITCFQRDSGNSKAIFILHGGPGLGSEYLSSFLKNIPDEYDVITYDQRGVGLSKQCEVSTSTITLTQFVEDLHSIRSYFSYETVGILGHSFGGLLAMKYAMRYPIDFLGLVNSASTTSLGLMQFELRRKSENQNLFLKKMLPSLFKKPAYSYPHTVTSELKTVFRLFEQTLFSKWYDFRKDLSSLSIPTFIAYGADDYMPSWAMKELASCFSKKEFHVLPNSGHYTFIDQETIFFTKLNDFLDKMCREKSKHTIAI